MINSRHKTKINLIKPNSKLDFVYRIVISLHHCCFNLLISHLSISFLCLFVHPNITVLSFLPLLLPSCEFLSSFVYLFIICLQKGMINYMGSSFFMQPLASHLAKQHGSSEGSRPHLIYRRSLDDIRNECQLLGEMVYA